MDSSFVIKPSAIAKTRAMRDPVAVRGTVETDATESRIVMPEEPGFRGGGRHKHEEAKNPEHRGDPTPHDHMPHDLVADPGSREVILRERDVRAAEREHPDHALLRLRAYRPAHDDAAAPASDDPHADIKA